MQPIRKTQWKGSRSTQNIKRFKQTEQKMTLFEMFERFMAFKETDGLAKPTIQGYYEHYHYLNDYLGGDVPNEEVTVELFRTYIGYMLNDQCLKPTTLMYVSEQIVLSYNTVIKKDGLKYLFTKNLSQLKLQKMKSNPLHQLK